MIAILSDVHGNAAALESVLTACDEAGATRFWFVGDCVGYAAKPNECAALLEARTEIALAGNHDLACTGLLSLSNFNDQIAASWKVIADMLDEQTKDWLDGLVSSHGEEEEIGLYHASPADPVWEYVTSPESFRRAFDTAEKNRIIIVGHSHLPFAVRELGNRYPDRIPGDGSWLDISEGRWVINPGSVGQPRDGDWRASYALLNEETMCISHRRAEYDLARTQAEIRATALPESNAYRLGVGQ